MKTDPFIIMADGNGYRASQILAVIVRRGNDPGVVLVLADRRQAHDVDTEDEAIFERDRILSEARPQLVAGRADGEGPMTKPVTNSR